MLKKRAIRKIFITTLTAFILLVLYSIPNLVNEEVLKTNMEIEYITNLGTDNIYLLDDNNLLVKSKVLLDTNSREEKVKQLLKNLRQNNDSKLPNGLKGVIPDDIKINKVLDNNGCIYIDFDNKINSLNQEKLEKIIEAIVYSIMDLGNVKGIKITINNEEIKGYNGILDKSIGINKKYNIKSRNNINKVVIYYLEKINGNTYYVPVTKYLNDSRNKVEIIVEELSSSYIYEPNLMSFLNSNSKLIDYNEDKNIMILDFNKAIFAKNSEIVEEVKYTLAYSVFANYDVNEVIIEVDGDKVETLSKKQLP